MKSGRQCTFAPGQGPTQRETRVTDEHVETSITSISPDQFQALEKRVQTLEAHIAARSSPLEHDQGYSDSAPTLSTGPTVSSTDEY